MPQQTPPLTLPHLILPQDAKFAWLQKALELPYPDPRDRMAWGAFTAASARLAQSHLPSRIQEELHEFFSPDAHSECVVRGREKRGALLIENLPVDADLPLTPDDGRRPARKTAVSEAVLAGLIEPHAKIFSYNNEKDGAPIHEVAPVAGKEDTPSNAGRVPFPCHTDVAFLAPDFSPQGLALLGLRNPLAAATSILALENILDSAPQSLIDSLSKPIFHHPSPSSFELAVLVTAPILWRDRRGGLRIAVQTHAVQPGNNEARAAIAELRALLASVEPHRVALTPGAALLFKNDRVLHARDAVAGDRWLQRAYFTSSLERFRQRAGSAPAEFVFDAFQLLRRPASLARKGRAGALKAIKKQTAHPVLRAVT
ncbi:MAG TPA: TauD/TfdA family dioxygenase [Bryobacteraceae bacterium]